MINDDEDYDDENLLECEDILKNLNLIMCELFAFNDRITRLCIRGCYLSLLQHVHFIIF